MKITVLNGSPKGKTSVTLQYVSFIQKKFPRHQLNILHIAERIKDSPKDLETLREVVDDVRSSDGVLWAFPLYYFLVHSHYKRFIELISENQAQHFFRDKVTAVLTTSIHFFDHTAHNYMQAVCDDLEMNYIGFFSAGMYDLLEAPGQEKLTLFAETFFQAIEAKPPVSRTYPPLTHRTLDYVPGPVGERIDPGSKKITLLTDSEDKDVTLTRMVHHFTRHFSRGFEIFNIRRIDIKGGCLGCIQCGYDNRCIYTGKDEFIDFYNAKVKTADILIFAGAIHDRYLSSRWKLFFDRSFFNTHTPSLMGKQVGFIISGPLSQIPNLRQILQAYAEVQQSNLVDFVTDESGDSVQLDAQLQHLARRLVRFCDQNYVRPSTFLGVGGTKIFRDDVWGRLRFPFRADHHFYKKHGFYDFPQKDFKARMTNAVLSFMTKIPSVRKEIYGRRIKDQMIKPLQKVLEQMK